MERHEWIHEETLNLKKQEDFFIIHSHLLGQGRGWQGSIFHGGTSIRTRILVFWGGVFWKSAEAYEPLVRILILCVQYYIS